ncbi:hypothetical protein D9M69_297270 [compost metagenome]
MAIWVEENLKPRLSMPVAGSSQEKCAATASSMIATPTTRATRLAGKGPRHRQMAISLTSKVATKAPRMRMKPVSSERPPSEPPSRWLCTRVYRVQPNSSATNSQSGRQARRTAHSSSPPSRADMMALSGNSTTVCTVGSSSPR